jgi:RNA polymerase sigma factor (TIGR02999 family)
LHLPSHPTKEAAFGMTPEEQAGGLEGSELVAVLYDEMRRLAKARMARIPAENTLQPTALVHEAYLRLVSGPEGQGRLWNSRGHFFGAASQAMRQILVEQARRKAAGKHGGGILRVDPSDADLAIEAPEGDVLALDRALERLEKEDRRQAEIVLLRSFGGLDREETAAALGLSVRTIDREWRYLLAWLHREIQASRDLLA